MPVRSAVGRWFLLVPVLLAGCSAADDGATGVVIETGPATTLPLAEHALDDPDEATVASVLAPSQVTASTAAPPPTPPPCTVADVELWTAGIRMTPSESGATTVDAVIRVRNVSDAWCEPDIGRSPRLDPRIEPDVWLQPGATADLVVGQEVDPCDEPALVSSVQVGIGDESVVVPSAVLTCGWWLTAFYPNDAATEPCAAGDLDVVATDRAVVVRNGANAPCSLGTPASGVRPESLFPGDVVAVGGRGDDACEGATARTVRVGGGDEGVGGVEVVVPDVPCDLVFDGGPPRSWYGAHDGPAASLGDGAAITEVLDALDPFA